MITGIQIRAARGALNWSSEELALKAGVGLQTIKRFEKVDGVPPSRSMTLIKVQETLESAGVQFLGGPTDGPGIRVRALT